MANFDDISTVSELIDRPENMHEVIKEFTKSEYKLIKAN